MKIRIKFAKESVMKYVGHLDMMRYFQKAMRRAEIPMKYSEGYNPHQIMSFAAPLGVGITSVGEYLDIETTEELEEAKALQALNATMVPGIRVLAYHKLPENAKNAMASVAAASYEISYKNGYECDLTLSQLKEMKQHFYDEASSIMIVKKTKKSERELDLKPLIYTFDIVEDEQHSIVYQLQVSTGSTDNIKPELVLNHFHQYAGMKDCEGKLAIHRLDLFTGEPGAFLSLGEV